MRPAQQRATSTELPPKRTAVFGWAKARQPRRSSARIAPLADVGPAPSATGSGMDLSDGPEPLRREATPKGVAALQPEFASAPEPPARHGLVSPGAHALPLSRFTSHEEIFIGTPLSRCQPGSPGPARGVSRGFPRRASRKARRRRRSGVRESEPPGKPRCSAAAAQSAECTTVIASPMLGSLLVLSPADRFCASIEAPARTKISFLPLASLRIVKELRDQAGA